MSNVVCDGGADDNDALCEKEHQYTGSFLLEVFCFSSNFYF